MPRDLRCPSRLHAVLVDGLVEVKCRSARCGASRHVVVLHQFDPANGLLVGTKTFRNPERTDANIHK